MDSSDLLADLLDRVRNRFYGKYRGTVTRVDSSTLRIKAKVPSVLLGQETGWCTACFPYAGPGVGLVFLPEEGAGVWIEFEGGDVSQPIWTGCYLRAGEAPDDAAPSVKVIVTKANHRIVLNDESETIEIRDDHDNIVTLDSDGIRLDRGKSVVVNDSKVDINSGGLEVL